MSTAADTIRMRACGLTPRIALVLGSGLGGLAEAVEEAIVIPYRDLPGFPQPRVGGHAGRLVIGRLGNQAVAVMQGRSHYYERGDAAAMKAPLAALKSVGCEILILTNAAGSLRHDIGPGSLMLVHDHINLTGINPLIGEPGDGRFVNMSPAYDIELADRFRAAARRMDIALADGTYMWFAGPSFETPAEVRAARVLGADAVGMSTVPETVLARYLGMRVVAICNITNLAAGMTSGPLSHTQTLAKSAVGAALLSQLIAGMLKAL